MLQKLADSNLSWPIINIHPMLKLLCFHTFIDWYMTHDYQIYLYVCLVKINIWQYGLRFSYLSPHFIIFNADEQKFLKISLNSLKYISESYLKNCLLPFWASEPVLNTFQLYCWTVWKIWIVLNLSEKSELLWKLLKQSQLLYSASKTVWTILNIAETVWTFLNIAEILYIKHYHNPNVIFLSETIV